MNQVVQSLLPLVLLIGLGAALIRSRFYGEPFRAGLDRFAYYIGLPALFVGELSASDFHAAGVERLTLVCVGGVLATWLLGWATARGLGLAGEQRGVFIQASLRGNLVFVGLPVIVFASGAAGETVRQHALLAVAPMVLLFNVIGVVVLLAPRHALGPRALLPIARSLLTNPLILACALGVALSLTGLRPPAPLLKTLALLGNTALPLALVSLGSSVATMPVRGHLPAALGASVVKLVLCPLAVAALAWAMQLSPEHRLIALVFAATPTAVASFILATQLKGDAALAAACVVVTTVLSLPAVAVVLMVVG